MDVYKAFYHLKNETSPKRALAFIKEKECLHKYIQYLLDPYVRTGVGSLNLNGVPANISNPNDLSIQLVDYFSNIGKDGSRIAKESFATKIYLQGPNDDIWKWFVELLATKGGNSTFGVGWSTAIKAGIKLKGFGCQLGVKMSDVKDGWIDGDGDKVHRWRISEKVDGTRRLFVKRNGQVECFSRSGREDGTLLHINKEFMSDRFPTNRIYDCEIVDKRYFGKVKSFEVRAKSVGKAARQSGDKTSLIAICFDYYDFDSPNEITLQRTRELKSIFNDHDLKFIQMVKLFGRIDGYEREKLNVILNNVLDNNGEGLMLQELSSTYVFDRTNYLLKVKRIEEYVGIVVGKIMGRKNTRLENSVSAIVCEVPGCTQWVRVGSGLSDCHRELFTNHYEDLKGSEIEIEAFSKTISKGGNVSLCFPVFKKCRHKLFEGCE